MPIQKPSLSLVALPGRRKAMIDLAQEIERRGFPGIYCPSLTNNMALCQSVAQATERVIVATSIAPIYSRLPMDYAQAAAFIHEISGGRFRFGVGVSHAPAHERMGITVGKPLGDMRAFVQAYHDAPRTGDKPPLILATLRKKMIALSAEIGDGMVFANGARSHMAASLAVLPAAKRNDPDFFIGNMIPTCISDDIDAAKAVNRRTLHSYVQLPNYRNYWKEAGYEEEMTGVEAAMATGDQDAITKCMSDAWLADSTIFGPVTHVLDEVEKWRDAGIREPIIVPSSAAGNQFKAFEEAFAAFDN
jgi:alkanesulfonate monooxygenase SsuD/methylene tetrahydromethanopterin reductase-like flavin-dependent oxidoreductase (luciferase family)